MINVYRNNSFQKMSSRTSLRKKRVPSISPDKVIEQLLSFLPSEIKKQLKAQGLLDALQQPKLIELLMEQMIPMLIQAPPAQKEKLETLFQALSEASKK
jgi:hypothetical protein